MPDFKLLESENLNGSMLNIVTDEVNLSEQMYQNNSVLLLKWENMEELILVRIKEVFIIEHSKYFICNKQDIVCFEDQIFCFQVVVLNKIDIAKPSYLTYVWPQRLYEQAELKYVMI